MDKTKPIKRHPAIAAFSRDHHFGLLLVWKIREGLKRSVSPERINKYILHFFEVHLLPHFRAEEELLFIKIAPGNKLRIQAEAEHQAVYKLVGELGKDTAIPAMTQRFADLLEKHIRFEERSLYNYLQEHIPEQALLEIAAGIKEDEPEAEWNDPFWENKR